MLYICNGMMRAGSTWQYQIASFLIKHFLNGVPCSYTENPAQLQAYLEQTLLENKPLIVKSHFITKNMGRDIEIGNVKLIYIYRDIRDVVCSAMIKFHLSFSDFFEKGVLDEITNEYYYTKSLKTKNALIQKYENVVLNPVIAVRQIADFVNVPLTKNKCREIVEEYSFEKQKQRIALFLKSLPLRHRLIIRCAQICKLTRYINFIKRMDKKFIYYDTNSLLHYNHINNGQIGKWRACLSSDQQYKINNWAANWLSDAGYRI